jgi:N-acetyl sugar amidotransferase
MPSSRPRIVFKDGICNACWYAEEKKEIDWDARKKEFLEVISGCGSGPYDCVVPFSGGKDSAYVAYRLRELGLKPLLCCYGQLLWTEVGQRNLHRVADLGFDIFYWRVDQRVSRKLARRFFIERGHPKQHYDAAVNAVPVLTAKAFNIPLIFYAEHGETEYGGLVLNEESRRTRDLREVLEHQVGDDARNWAVDGISERDLFPYTCPSDVDGITAYYFSYFFPWSIWENAEFAKDVMGFERVQPRSDASFEGADSIDDMIDGSDFHAMFLKFGFGRATRMASRLIQSGHMTRQEGLRLVQKYDHEFPEMYLPEVLEYLDMNRMEFHRILDLHRNPEIWEEKDGQWALRYPPR